MVSRVKVLREPGWANYPFFVCECCGKYAASESKTKVYSELDLRLGDCEVCAARLTQVAQPQQFGFPIFYTYMNGQPIRRGT